MYRTDFENCHNLIREVADMRFTQAIGIGLLAVLASIAQAGERDIIVEDDDSGIEASTAEVDLDGNMAIKGVASKVNFACGAGATAVFGMLSIAATWAWGKIAGR